MQPAAAPRSIAPPPVQPPGPPRRVSLPAIPTLQRMAAPAVYRPNALPVPGSLPAHLPAQLAIPVVPPVSVPVGMPTLQPLNSAALTIPPPAPAATVQPMPAPSPPFAQAQGSVVQPVRFNSGPKGARGALSYYTKNGRRFATDGSRHWYQKDNNQWVKTVKSPVPLHNRFRPTVLGRGGDRKAKFTTRFGSGASYSDTNRRVRILKATPLTGVIKPSKAKRQYAQNMQVLTGTRSATQHAANVGAPRIVGGYNWCHLVGHGAGGSDLASNVVAASTHANSEQLALESVFYNFKDSQVSLKYASELFRGQVASKIHVYVYVKGHEVYRRSIDALRKTTPTWTELQRARHDLTRAITGALN